MVIRRTGFGIMAFCATTQHLMCTHRRNALTCGVKMRIPALILGHQRSVHGERDAIRKDDCDDHLRIQPSRRWDGRMPMRKVAPQSQGLLCVYSSAGGDLAVEIPAQTGHVRMASTASPSVIVHGLLTSSKSGWEDTAIPSLCHTPSLSEGRRSSCGAGSSPAAAFPCPPIDVSFLPTPLLLDPFPLSARCSTLTAYDSAKPVQVKFRLVPHSHRCVV